MLHNINNYLSDQNESVFNPFKTQLDSLPATKAAPAQLRVDLFKTILTSHSDRPENVSVEVIRKLFDHDLNFAKWCLNDWDENNKRATTALRDIELFFSQIQLPEKMSFSEHSYYCFCISALLSGIAIEDINTEYKKNLRTMVYGVVHPRSDNWSIKNELEHQDYAKYISHVSKTGLVTVELINNVSTFRLNKQSPFCGIRILAIACNEQVEFDGVKEMEVDGIKRETRSIDVLKHDYIHAAFLKRHFEKDPDDYWARFAELGEIYEKITGDNELASNVNLRMKVLLAWFFWLHEYTTSTYVDGIPEALPKPHMRIHGQYATEPQILLRFAAKLNIFPTLFANEVKTELDLFKSLRINLDLADHEKPISDYALVKEMMNQLDEGYAYLDKHYSKLYDLDNRTYWRMALLIRLVKDSTIGQSVQSFFHSQPNTESIEEKNADYKLEKK